MTDLMNKKCSYNIICSTVYSIKWAHSLKGLDDPTDNSHVKNLLVSEAFPLQTSGEKGASYEGHVRYLPEACL